MTQLALITGANRGLGFEAARQLAKKGVRVLLSSRDTAKGQQAVTQLAKEGLEVLFHPLDVANAASIDDISNYVTEKFKRLDILINNAGIFVDDLGADAIRKSFESNVLGAYQLCQKFLPLMKASNYGRVVNVSSGMGQLSEMNGGYPAYRISKTALNAVTKIFADEGKSHNILINSICPGWVRTDMGGPNAHRSIEEGVDTIVWAATLSDGGPTGGFFRDRKAIPW